jgi:DNA integrity scanning protein DisA with diadenylate cyclase activity
MTEQSDAIAIIVSEENGSISLADSGSIKIVPKDRLHKVLQNALYETTKESS